MKKYTMYSRVEKSEQNPFGVDIVLDGENPFLKGPCICCFHAQNWKNSKDAFGVSKIVAGLCGLRTTESEEANYSLKDFPVDVLTFIQEPGESENPTEDFIDRFLLPLVSDKNGRVDVKEAAKRCRNINLFGFCNGNAKIEEIFSAFKARIETIGYTKEECEKIMSQVCTFAFSTETDLNRLWYDNNICAEILKMRKYILHQILHQN